MRILDYPRADEFVKNDTYLLLDSNAKGTKSAELEKLREEMVSRFTLDEYYKLLDNLQIPTEIRRQTFRGKNLGTFITNEQRSEIKSGRFKDLFLGDYWVHSNKTFRIADFDYWLGKGDTSCIIHHAVIVPDEPLTMYSMNTTDTVEGGYFGSSFAQYTMPSIETNYIVPFSGETGSGLLYYRNSLSTAITNGGATSFSWVNCSTLLMNELMVFASYHAVKASDGTDSTVYSRNTMDVNQLALFKVAPGMINHGRKGLYWLRDVASNIRFACVSSSGVSDAGNASATGGIRPVFGITGLPPFN